MNKIRERAAIFDHLLSDRENRLQEFIATEPDLCKAAVDAFLEIEQLAAYKDFCEKRKEKKRNDLG